MTVEALETAASDFEAAVTGEIRAEMARQRISNRQIAFRIGKTPFWVGDRLRGKTHMEVLDLQLFADALRVPVEQFVSVRHQGLEPRTRCLSDAELQEPLPILFAVPDQQVATDDNPGDEPPLTEAA